MASSSKDPVTIQQQCKDCDLPEPCHCWRLPGSQRPGKTLPDIRTLLPSKAKAALTEFLLEHLKVSRLDGYGEPKFNVREASETLSGVDGYYYRSLIHECFAMAKTAFDEKFPLTWVQSSDGLLLIPVRQGLEPSKLTMSTP